MPAPHYALSEAVIVLVAIWVGWRFVTRGAWFGALGGFLFGVAAALGVYRFGSGQIDALANAHRIFSQIGGATAMALVAAQCLLALFGNSRRWLAVAVLAVMATLAAGVIRPGLTTPLFLGWSIVAIGAVVIWPATAAKQRLVRGGLMAIFLANLLLVRRSPVLGPDLSWHLFHVLIAVWLIGLRFVFDRARA